MRAFGKYRLIEPIASGGMAEVWRAEAPGPEGFVKEVALKLVRAGKGPESEFVKMFAREARLASRLTHANIVQVFDFDEVDGEYYIAMELVRGKTLREVVQRCRERGVRLGLARAVHVMAEVARALAYAHGLKDGGRPLGLVHRDVSPQNVLLSFEGEVKLADFGIARAMDAVEITAPGTIKGKAAYMAPEQARGEAVDARADVFAVGVMLWELCTGRRLFARDSEANTLAALLGGEPPSPPSAWNEEVPTELDALVMGALERDPARRTHGAEELAQALAEMRLRLAAGASDLDLRAFIRRLWPEGPEPVRRPGQTLVRPASSMPATRVEDEIATRTLPRPARGTRRPVLVAALVVACLGAGVLGGGVALARKAGKGSAPSAGTPIAASTATATPTATPGLSALSGTRAATPPANARSNSPQAPTAPATSVTTASSTASSTAAATSSAAPPLTSTATPGLKALSRPRAPTARSTAPATPTRTAAPTPTSTVAPTATPAAAPLPHGPLARPKRVSDAMTVEGSGHRVPEAHPHEKPIGSNSPSIRRIASARSTLARGTLVPVRLVRGIDPAEPGLVEAVVTDDVLSGGILLVPKGSATTCRSRPSKDGRVPVSCETIKTADRLYSFSGLAVGEGQRVGLPALEGDEVPAGTPFVVYVNASAPLR